MFQKLSTTTDFPIYIFIFRLRNLGCVCVCLSVCLSVSTYIYVWRYVHMGVKCLWRLEEGIGSSEAWGISSFEPPDMGSMN